MVENKTALLAAIRQLAETWRKKLTSLDRRNPTLYFKHLKAGTLRLPEVSTEGVTALIDQGCSLDLTEVMEWTPECQKRMLAIRSKARENEEERGIQTMFLALGMATWKSADGGRDPNAPVLLLPVTVTEPAKHPTLNRAGDLMVNRVMLQAWEQDHKHKPSIFDADEVNDIGILRALGQMSDAGKSLEGFQVSTECYLGNFSFAKMAMVEDLKRNEALLALNRLVCALAGDRESVECIKENAGTVERDELDDIDPINETIVLEADEYQRQAIHSLIRFNADGVVDGPPGTGKSQTIANLIAGLVASGSRVLFVAEKRAALDAVFNRLSTAGLEDIVLDLHGAEARRKTIYERLRHRDDRARLTEDRPPTTPIKNLKELRAKLNAYYRAVNKEMAGCGLSVREVISRLAKLNPQAASATLWYDDLDSLTDQLHDQAQAAVETLAQDAPLFLRDQAAPWSRAAFATSAEAADAVRFVAESKTNILTIRQKLATVGKLCDCRTLTFKELGWTCQVVHTIGRSRETFNDVVVTVQPEELLLHLEPLRKHFLARTWAFVSDGRYREAVKKIQACSKSSDTPINALLERLGEFAKLPAPVRNEEAFGLITAEYVSDVKSLWNSVRNVRKSLTELSGETLPEDLDGANDQLGHLESSHRSARRIPDVRKAEQFLRDNRYGDLVNEFERTSITPSLWGQMTENAWLRSFLEKAKSDEPMLGGFSRESFERMRSEFQNLDAKQLARSRITVRRSTAEAYVKAKNARPDQATVFKAELQKKARNLPIRKLVEKAGNVMTALCPCWMASPLSVSQLLPGDHVLFDVVIFDEASQVMPEDAIPSIMRAKRAIVAGDQKQLPPTTFFASGTTDPEDDEGEYNADPELLKISTEGMESILDVMLTFCNRQPLNVHYRSLDESLIRFSNHEFYYDRLITFPNAYADGKGLGHILVESPRNDGEEMSSSAEISRVVDLIFEHAEQRPSQTLGVIALGLKHARRIEAAIAERRSLRADLDEFFVRGNVNESFFVKNLERVQGDERDAIILSFGYAKDGAGNLLNRLGPINQMGGERRLNVAVTRAKTRMTVVSTFTENDMDRSRFSSRGAQILSRYLAYARTGGTRLDDVQETEVEMNEFERDVMDTLTSKGLRLVPQLGVSKYRLDFAVQHPNIPNKYVLAIECDGAPYHSSATARDRDRLRQAHLESRGWRFHRIWSLDWHEQRASEIDRVLEAYAVALAESERSAKAETTPSDVSTNTESAARPRARSRKPYVWPSGNIYRHSEDEIQRVIEWICSDGILRSDDEILTEAVPALGFQRRGRLVDERVRESVARWRRNR